MDTLIPQNFVLRILASLAIVLTASVVALILARIIRNFLLRRAEKISRVQIDQLWAIVSDGAKADISMIRPTVALRDAIASTCSLISGDHRRKWMEIYYSIGCTALDFKDMLSPIAKTRARALARCRSLLLPIPIDGWKILFKDRNLSIRWAALEYLVELDPEYAAGWIDDYLETVNPNSLGQAMHLLCCIASKRPESITELLERTRNPFVIELCLRVLAVYPAPNTHKLISRFLINTASEEAVIAGMKALGAFPFPDSFPIYESFLSHPHWVVRLEIARAMRNYNGPRAVAILEALSLDTSFYVRIQSIRSMLTMSEECDLLLANVAGDPDHPCYDILRGMELDQAQAA